jgi:hypothetical protein
VNAHADADRVREYHDTTKHHFHRFARSAGYLDWATQPDPFRRFDGAEPIDLVALRLAAAMMGWHARVVPECPSAALASLLGVDRDDDFDGAEREEPECLLVVTPGPCPDWRPRTEDLQTALAGLAAGSWQGRANRLSPDRVAWDAIDTVAEATRAPGATIDRPDRESGSDTIAGGAHPGAPAAAACRLFLQRRSAVEMTGEGGLTLEQFCLLLRRLLPGSTPPWDALCWEPRVHLALFVHRVTGLEPGLYAFLRSPSALGSIRQALRDDFAWIRPPGVPDARLRTEPGYGWE